MAHLVIFLLINEHVYLLSKHIYTCKNDQSANLNNKTKQSRKVFFLSSRPACLSFHAVFSLCNGVLVFAQGLWGKKSRKL